MATKLVDLVYWRNLRKTGVVFTGLVIGLASLFQLSAITVLSHILLGIMCLTFPLRLYYKLLELLRWNPGVHPFQSYLDYDSSLTDKETVMVVEEVVLLIAFAVTEIKRLLFIDSLVDSIKFAVLLYLLTYVGVQINGLTLVIAGELHIYTRYFFFHDFVCCDAPFCCRCLSLYASVRPSEAPEPAPKPALAAAPKQKAKSK
uniref:Reticulon n=1 Tax=Acanthochromis polyacanthus TaxID=80966 RepID=A0A3Q1EW15_9TELE